MPKKGAGITPVTALDWQKFVNYSMEQQNIAEFQAKLHKMTGRELYNLETLSLMPRYLIDRPVNYAFHRTQINYPLQPVEVMKAALMDGAVFIRVEDATHMRIEPYVTRWEWDRYDDLLLFIETKYVFVAENDQDYFYIEHFHRTPEGGATWYIYNPVKDDQDEKTWTIAFAIDLPFFPFVGIPWIDSTSFLEPLKTSLVRLEAAFQVIGAENIERMGLSLYIEGVVNVDEIKTAPRRMGRRVHILPKDAKFHSPAPDAPGMELMITELENLNTAIEKASGVVSTEKLATLSGVSRAIAEKPLIILAEELRNRFSKGMAELIDQVRMIQPGSPDLKISYRPLRHIEDRNSYLTLLDKAKEAEAIDDAEYAAELRLMLDLDPQE